MSATELRDRSVQLIDAEIDSMVNVACNVRGSRGAIGRNGAGQPTQTVPPSGIEDIALLILETNAFRRGLDKAREIIVQQHQKLIAPDSIPSGAGEEEKKGADPIY